MVPGQRKREFRKVETTNGLGETENTRKGEKQGIPQKFFVGHERPGRILEKKDGAPQTTPR